MRTPKRYPEIERFRTIRRRTLDLVAGLSQAQIDRPPGRERWSLGEVLDHLVRTDQQLLPDLEGLVARSREGKKTFLYRGFEHYGLLPPLVPRPLAPFIGLPFAFLSVLVPTPVRSAVTRLRVVPAKAPAQLRPRSGRWIADLQADLESMISTVDRLQQRNPGLDFRRLTYYNPLIGYTNYPGLLAFAASHESRHQEQIRELLE